MIVMLAPSLPKPAIGETVDAGVFLPVAMRREMPDRAMRRGAALQVFFFGERDTWLAPQRSARQGRFGKTLGAH
jgi:hypothetical protein